MDFPSPPSPPPAPAPAYLRLKTTFAGKRQSPTAVSAAPFPATSSSKSTRIKTTLQTPTPHPHPHPNPNPHPQYSLDSDIPIHKQKGVNLLYNGPTSSFTRGGVEKWTRYTTTTSASMAAISHSSSKQQQEQQQQQLPPQTPIYNINNYSDSDSTHNWPAWKVQAWHDQCQDQQRELLDRRNIGNTRAESVEVTAFGSNISDQTINKLTTKLDKLRFFRADLRHRMKHLSEKKQLMIGAVLEKVQEDTMLRHTRCHIHKTRKPLDPKQSASHQALQRCLSEEDIPLDQLPNDRSYIVYPEEPYHFHKQHFVAPSYANDRLDNLNIKSANPQTSVTEHVLATAGLSSDIDPERELKIFYKAGWVDEMRKREFGRVYNNTIKKYSHEQRQQAREKREAAAASAAEEEVVDIPSPQRQQQRPGWNSIVIPGVTSKRERLPRSVFAVRSAKPSSSSAKNNKDNFNHTRFHAATTTNSTSSSSTTSPSRRPGWNSIVIPGVTSSSSSSVRRDQRQVLASNLKSSPRFKKVGVVSPPQSPTQPQQPLLLRQQQNPTQKEARDRKTAWVVSKLFDEEGGHQAEEEEEEADVDGLEVDEDGIYIIQEHPRDSVLQHAGGGGSIDPAAEYDASLYFDVDQDL